jgi:hypothetical protein
MTILIANIGTSDLVVQIDGFNYFFPLDARDEPNIDKSSLDSSQAEAWQGKDTYIQGFLCSELSVPFSEKKEFFRPLTKKLLEVYKADPKSWHPRIRPGRIFGAIQEAREKFSVTEIYLFITDQRTKNYPDGHYQDSIYLFEILKEWFGHELENLNFTAEYIPSHVSANNQDALLDYYYQFFQKIDVDQTILVSIKGGTPQMQNALRIQAISSATQNQIFIDPLLSARKVLLGESSTCRLTSYWRYTRNQKYQTVVSLLDRWDFDGAIKILGGWQKNLDDLIKMEVIDEDISRSNDAIKHAITSLEIARLCLNLDITNAEKLAGKNSALGLSGQVKNYDLALNFYTQCRIYWELEQVAIFLSRMSSFYEEILQKLIVGLGGGKYFSKNRDGSINWCLRRSEVEIKLWNSFIQLENSNTPISTEYRLSSRLKKKNFLEAVIQSCNSENVNVKWKHLNQALDSLEFWVRKRNNLIHNGDGISKERMPRALAEAKNDNDSKEVAKNACAHDKILEVMTRIYKQSKEILNAPQSEYLYPNGDYYIYSTAKKKGIEMLIDSSLMPVSNLE